MLSKCVPSPTKCNNQSKSKFYPTFFNAFSHFPSYYCAVLPPKTSIQRPSFETQAACRKLTSMFDPTAMPIRSSIRPIDERISKCVLPHKNVRFADSATNQLFPTHPRAWRIKRSKPIPETTPKTSISLTLISSLWSEKSKKNKKTVRVKLSFIERAIHPD